MFFRRLLIISSIYLADESTEINRCFLNVAFIYIKVCAFVCVYMYVHVCIYYSTHVKVKVQLMGAYGS